MNVRKISILGAAVIMAVSMLGGCGNKDEGKTEVVKTEQVSAKPEQKDLEKQKSDKNSNVLYPSDHSYQEFQNIPLLFDEDGWKKNITGDFDGDGKKDKAEKIANKSDDWGRIRVIFGNGERIESEKFFFPMTEFKMINIDLNGNGNKELIFLTNSGSCGGDGMYNLLIYGKIGEAYKKIDLPDAIKSEDRVTGVDWVGTWTGKQFTIQAKGMSEKFVLSKNEMDAYYKGSDSEDNKFWMEDWKKVKADDVSGTDGISAFTVKRTSTETKVVFRQYMGGPTGHHLDGIGYLVTEMQLDKNYKWTKVKNYFLFREKIA